MADDRKLQKLYKELGTLMAPLYVAYEMEYSQIADWGDPDITTPAAAKQMLLNMLDDEPWLGLNGGVGEPIVDYIHDEYVRAVKKVK